MANSRLGDFLKEKRERAGLSQKTVSNKLGYSTAQFVSNWERGISHPPVTALKKIAHLYGITAEDLFEKLKEQATEDLVFGLEKKFNKSKAK